MATDSSFYVTILRSLLGQYFSQAEIHTLWCDLKVNFDRESISGEEKSSRQVQLLSDKSATRSHILDALEKLAAITIPESTPIVYFSGHGYWAQTLIGEAFYLMPFGYDLNRLYETAVSDDEFAARLKAIPARWLRPLLDCCHAGGQDDSKTSGMSLSKANHSLFK